MACYNHALGVHLAALLEATCDSLGAGALALTDMYAESTGSFIPSAPGPVASMEDRRSFASAWVRFRVEGTGLDVAVRGEWRDRRGSVNG
jgi:hypothetical protein